ncbi:Elongation of very long chain fatty acids protein 1 [Halotydeus destructor]|nr:Elongation of very long chain fatty acids protein 1 [Halotydeus destructor]
MTRSLLSDYATKLDVYMDSIGTPGFGNDHAPGFPWKICATVACYLLFVLKVGPEYMSGRKAYHIDGLMRLYNVVNIVVNIAMFATGMYYLRMSLSCYKCIGVDEMAHIPQWALKFVSVGYLYLKVFDLLDTVFFVLRKKNNQITALHVIHHSVMPLGAYVAIKFNPYSPSANVTILNCFVHVVMYTYYFAASLGPHVQRRLWWKKYITAIQLAQFIILLSQAVYMLTVHSGSRCSKFFSCLQITEASYFVYAFGMFYVNSYTKSSKLKAN